MHFIKGVAKWATIWTVLILPFLLYSVGSEGKPLTFYDVLVISEVCWIMLAGLVTVFRLKMIMRTYCDAAARRLVQGARESDKEVMERALVAGGFKSAPSPKDLPPPLPRQ